MCVRIESLLYRVSIAHSSHYDRYPENNLRDIALPSDNDIGSRITFAEAYKANLISL